MHVLLHNDVQALLIMEKLDDIDELFQKLSAQLLEHKHAAEAMQVSVATPQAFPMGQLAPKVCTSLAAASRLATVVDCSGGQSSGSQTLYTLVISSVIRSDAGQSHMSVRSPSTSSREQLMPSVLTTITSDFVGMSGSLQVCT